MSTTFVASSEIKENTIWRCTVQYSQVVCSEARDREISISVFVLGTNVALKTSKMLTYWIVQAVQLHHR